MPQISRTSARSATVADAFSGVVLTGGRSTRMGRDKALLPVQLEGLNDLVDDLRIVTSTTAGHFIPWEEPGTVTSAIRDFLAETAG